MMMFGTQKKSSMTESCTYLLDFTGISGSMNNIRPTLSMKWFFGIARRRSPWILVLCCAVCLAHSCCASNCRSNLRRRGGLRVFRIERGYLRGRERYSPYLGGGSMACKYPPTRSYPQLGPCLFCNYTTSLTK
jgi:hypothetical protein